MSSETDLTTTNVTDQLVQLGLAQGTLRLRTFDLRPGHQIEIDTPNAALTVLRSGNYRVEVYPSQNMTILTVNSGEVEVGGGDGEQATVNGGESVRLTGANPAQMQSEEAPAADDFDRWSSDRDRRYLASNSRRYVSPDVPGYYDLDQYGNWETDAEGPVWYPSGVQVGWTPYRYGRWAWVEPWGWTWVEEEPWGFAPFHYGRWIHVGPRWGWLPGPVAIAPVYGPAFVAFVGGISFGAGVSAWFPLGPGEPFNPWYHHSDTYLRQVNVTNVRNVTNITNITNITNVTNIHYTNQAVGTTAVSSNAFRSAQPVARNLVHVDPQEIAHAKVVPHPEVTPDSRAIVGGAPASHPSVQRARPVVAEHPPVATGNRPRSTASTTSTNGNTPNGRPATPQPHTPPANANASHTPPPVANPSRPPATTEARTPPPAAPNEPRTAAVPPTHNAPPPANESVRPTPSAAGASRPPAENRGTTPPANRPALVTKTPPPSEHPAFQQKQPAMEEHPGRPLEPQQKANIQQGKPAGPMQDKENPPHPPAAHPAAPAPHAEPAPHSAPPPASHPEKTPAKDEKPKT
jgi:hypothetical protein